MMVALMLLSTQMYNFIGVDQTEANLETIEETPARTAYQQFHQAEGASAGTTQGQPAACLLYTSPSPRDISGSRMPSSA